MGILVTGSAGFIGYSLALSLLKSGHDVVGLDNHNDYYDTQLKEDRLNRLAEFSGYKHVRGDFSDASTLTSLFEQYDIDRVVHLGAQAGVRYSIDNPSVYAQSNLVGMLNVLESCRHFQVSHLIYASSSSVYGMNGKMPFSTEDRVDHPVSLYAATKKSNELMAHSYSHLYGLPTTGLRFFTVYGPWGRPDMAPFLFLKAIIEGRPIKVFNNGQMKRDFTYIDDIVEGVIRLLDKPPRTNPKWSNAPSSESFAPYKVYNIGNNEPVELMTFISALESAVGKEAIKEFLPMQKGDVPTTFADIEDLRDAVGFAPDTRLSEGLQKFADWYVDYYKIKL
ncbi:NAD-dependent epimerase [Gilvimarinus xylanilyticus]|uniref:NAD-dependent epimerase n=1 Tax=Gilvimarinus xylanilyticus TaxID=2944139 RepID=A0A9X2KUH9_9GAMM|nr:NAD-dependent epimerase [Gilvimarinus xylanilyticus]MCP8900282.1 NAD-dependent epimerase [Gilvimarinus xylanilyticus]